MARGQTGRTKKSTQRSPKKPAPRKRTGQRGGTSGQAWYQTIPWEIVGLFLIAVGGVTLLALMSVTEGAVSDSWTAFLRRIFGWGAWVIALLLIAGGVALLLRRTLQDRALAPWSTVIGVELVFFALLGLTHTLDASSDPLLTAQAGRAGGYIGWAIRYLLEDALGRWPAVAVVSLAFVVGVSLTVRPWWGHILLGLGRQVNVLNELVHRSPAEEPEPDLAFPESQPSAPAQPKPKTRTTRRKAASPSSDRARGASSSRSEKTQAKSRRDPILPPLDLFKADAADGSDDVDIRYLSQTIEETLVSLGVPAKVVEVNRGPTVTQFGVEPGYVERRDRHGQITPRKIRVSQIANLSKDLALALAAAPIRIEAPVPGRSMVGIEMPNPKVSMVGLRGILETQEFRRVRSKLKIALGRDVSGRAVVADLAAMPHLLIAGATGSGKSVCLNAIIACLLYNNRPEDLRMVLIDPKRVELTLYNGIPHLLAPVEVDPERIVRALTWVTREMDRRYRVFSEAGKRNLTAYNRGAKTRGDEPMYRIVVLIDELADLMLVSPDEVERAVCRVAQMARATGIHLVMATQRPSVDVVTGLIKANFPARISFAVSSQVDSRVILDTPGADKLLGRGDMLFMSPDSSKLSRIQGCFVSDAELSQLVYFWRRAMISDLADEEGEAVPWNEGDFLAQQPEDPLLAQAMLLASDHGQLSTSWLQRQMRIGYPRAARLMDKLEELGIVGPSEGGGRSRQVLASSEDEPDATGSG